MKFKRGKTKGKCKNCNDEYYLDQPHQEYCDPACRQQAYRKREKEKLVKNND